MIKGNLLRLNLGCGPHYAPGWTNIDRHDKAVPDGRQVDVVVNVLALPFDDESCSHVYMGHLIEHLRLEDEVPAALREIRRVLVPGGELMVVAPDITRARAGWPEMISAIEPGEGDEKLPAGIPHLWAPTEATALAACLSVFPNAVTVPIGEVGWPWPLVDPVGWQLAIHAVA